MGFSSSVVDVYQLYVFFQWTPHDGYINIVEKVKNLSNCSVHHPWSSLKKTTWEHFWELVLRAMVYLLLLFAIITALKPSHSSKLNGIVENEIFPINQQYKLHTTWLIFLNNWRLLCQFQLIKALLHHMCQYY
jgi:hypothetical protein